MRLRGAQHQREPPGTGPSAPDTADWTFAAPGTATAASTATMASTATNSSMVVPR